LLSVKKNLRRQNLNKYVLLTVCRILMSSDKPFSRYLGVPYLLASLYIQYSTYTGVSKMRVLILTRNGAC
jgi:hypothetical protein